MISLLAKYPEIVPLVFNIGTAVVHGYQGNWAKFAYWFGASIITVSLMGMK